MYYKLDCVLPDTDPGYLSAGAGRTAHIRSANWQAGPLQAVSVYDPLGRVQSPTPVGQVEADREGLVQVPWREHCHLHPVRGCTCGPAHELAVGSRSIAATPLKLLGSLVGSSGVELPMVDLVQPHPQAQHVSLRRERLE